MSRIPRKPPHTLTDAAQAPAGGMCLLCGRLLGAEPHYITELPDGEHEICRDVRLSAGAFPYDGQLERLRSLVRLLRSQYDVVVETGKWIATVKSQWPKTRGAFEKERVERIRKLKSGLAALHAELGRFGRRNWF